MKKKLNYMQNIFVLARDFTFEQTCILTFSALTVLRFIIHKSGKNPQVISNGLQLATLSFHSKNMTST